MKPEYENIPCPMSLSPEEKRQVLFAALLRYTSEARSLRERALDRVIRSALIGSDENNPFRIGQIQENLKFGPEAPVIRTETIQETLDRLIEHGQVVPTEFRKRKAYFLKPCANEDLSQAIESASALFNTVLKRLLKDTGHLVDFETGAVVCRAFISECFARFGREIAQTVTGQLTTESLVRIADVKVAFLAAVKDRGLSQQAINSLGARCEGFLKSKEPEDERLKFYLTQGYYFAQLLGLESKQFNPLAEEAFSGSVIYLDTNVLFLRFQSLHESAPLFDEMVTVARRLGVELRVTRATINEARGVVYSRYEDIKKVVAAYPEEVLRHSKDQFLQAYFEAKDRDPSLTPEQFIDPFDRLSTLLENELGLVIIDKVEEDYLNKGNYSRVAQVIQEEAEKVRRTAKSERV